MLDKLSLKTYIYKRKGILTIRILVKGSLFGFVEWMVYVMGMGMAMAMAMGFVIVMVRATFSWFEII